MHICTTLRFGTNRTIEYSGRTLRNQWPHHWLAMKRFACLQVRFLGKLLPVLVQSYIGVLSMLWRLVTQPNTSLLTAALVLRKRLFAVCFRVAIWFIFFSTCGGAGELLIWESSPAFCARMAQSDVQQPKRCRSRAAACFSLD